MKINDILKTACEFTNLTVDFSAEVKDEVATRLETYFNRVLEEIATEYHPFICREEISGSVIRFSALSKVAVDIKEVRDKSGRKLRFKNFIDHIVVDGEAKSITYSFLPEEMKIGEELSFSKIPVRVYAYGIAREYFLAEGLKSDAILYEERFKDSLANLLRSKTNATIPARPWLQ